MPEDVARAVGAPDPEPIMIAGKECQVRPLTISELTEIERECLKSYKKRYLSTFADNVELLEDGQKILQDKFQEAATWDVQDLPPKWAYDPAKVKVIPQMAAWLKEKLDYEHDEKDSTAVRTKKVQRMIAASLDQELMEEKDYEAMTNEKPKKFRVGYVNWWITGTYEGMTTMAWLCFKGSGVTKEEVCSELSRRPDVLINLSRQIEHLSAPATGNG